MKGVTPICSDFPVFFRSVPIPLLVSEYPDLLRSLPISSDLCRFVSEQIGVPQMGV